MTAGSQGLSTSAFAFLTVVIVASVASFGPGVGSVQAQPIFTGHTETDFFLDRAIEIPDPGGVDDVGFPSPPFLGTMVPGWQLLDFRLFYEESSDTLYVGLNYVGIAGDADGDGDPGGTSAVLQSNGGTDFPSFASTESFVVLFDTDRDGLPDVVTGVDALNDLTGFRTAVAIPGQQPAFAFGANLPQHTGTVFADPSAANPDIQFTVPQFSTLPGFPPVDRFLQSILFNVSVFTGSLDDDGIGEDNIPPHLITIGKASFDLGLEDGEEVTDQFAPEGLQIMAQSDCGLGGAFINDPTNDPSTDDIIPTTMPFVLTTRCTLDDESSDSGMFIFRFVSPLNPDEPAEATFAGLSFLDIEDSGTPGRGRSFFEVIDNQNQTIQSVLLPNQPSGSQFVQTFSSVTGSRGQLRTVSEVRAAVGDQDDSGAVDTLCYILTPCPLGFGLQIEGPENPVRSTDDIDISLKVENVSGAPLWAVGAVTLETRSGDVIVLEKRRVRFKKKYDNRLDPIRMRFGIPDELKPRAVPEKLAVRVVLLQPRTREVLAHALYPIMVMPR